MPLLGTSAWCTRTRRLRTSRRSGWKYPDWRGRFYPGGLPRRRWLEHYATGFATVESNAAFDRLPERDTFAA